MKKFLSIIVLAFIINTANATETPNQIEVTKIDATTNMIRTTFKIKANETYHIQKSIDGKTFKTIALVIGSEDVDQMPPFSIKDKTTKGKNVTYKIVKIENN
jgi:hypothetical protein